MVGQTLFWAGFGELVSLTPHMCPKSGLLRPLLGILVRFWQLGCEMRPFFNRGSLWAYPLFAGVGGSFGFWMSRVERRQLEVLADRRNKLLEKRQRRAERAERGLIGTDG